MMGIPWEDATQVGSLMGVKIVLNEFLAYQELGSLIAAGELSERSRIIASYALCGFANFGSLAILLGGIGAMAPERRAEVAELEPARFAVARLTPASRARLATVSAPSVRSGRPSSNRFMAALSAAWLFGPSAVMRHRP